jgi:hypothetical protein
MASGNMAVTTSNDTQCITGVTMAQLSQNRSTYSNVNSVFQVYVNTSFQNFNIDCAVCAPQ